MTWWLTFLTLKERGSMRELSAVCVWPCLCERESAWERVYRPQCVFVNPSFMSTPRLNSNPSPNPKYSSVQCNNELWQYLLHYNYRNKHKVIGHCVVMCKHPYRGRFKGPVRGVCIHGKRCISWLNSKWPLHLNADRQSHFRDMDWIQP